MLANGFGECQCGMVCARVTVLLFSPIPAELMCVWSLPKVFHTCGKNCGNSTRSVACLHFCQDLCRFRSTRKSTSAVNRAFPRIRTRRHWETRGPAGAKLRRSFLFLEK